MRRGGCRKLFLKIAAIAIFSLTILTGCQQGYPPYYFIVFPDDYSKETAQLVASSFQGVADDVISSLNGKISSTGEYDVILSGLTGNSTTELLSRSAPAEDSDDITVNVTFNSYTNGNVTYNGRAIFEFTKGNSSYMFTVRMPSSTALRATTIHETAYVGNIGVSGIVTDMQVAEGGTISIGATSSVYLSEMSVSVDGARVDFTPSGNDDDSSIGWYNNTDTNFEINTASELKGLASLIEEGFDTFEGKTIVLASDVDLEGVEWSPVYMKGTFNGAGHTIYNLKVDVTATGVGSAGFFRSVSGRVEDLTFRNAEIELTASNGGAGVVAGFIDPTGVIAGVNVEDSSITAISDSMLVYSGAIAGTGNGEIRNSKSIDNKIDSSDYAGGIIGWATSANIIGNHVELSSNGIIKGGIGAGGIAGACEYESLFKENSVDIDSIDQIIGPEKSERLRWFAGFMDYYGLDDHAYPSTFEGNSYKLGEADVCVPVGSWNIELNPEIISE